MSMMHVFMFHYVFAVTFDITAHVGDGGRHTSSVYHDEVRRSSRLKDVADTLDLLTFK